MVEDRQSERVLFSELQREDNANSPFSQSETAGKSWFRPCSSGCRLKLQSCAIRNDMEEFGLLLKTLEKGEIISMRRRF